MKTNQFVVLALLLGLPALSLHAQDNGPGGPPPNSQDGPGPGGPGDQGGPGGHRHRPPPLPIVTALDANHDGVISADEIANASKALLTLDKNGDGQLTKDEYLPPRPPHKNDQANGQNPPGGPGDDGPPPPKDGQNGGDQDHPQRPIPPIVKALDTDGDGIISAAEINNASKSLLTLDKNGDGQLTMDEIMGPRPHRGGPDGRPGFDGPGHGGQGNGQQPPPPPQN